MVLNYFSYLVHSCAQTTTTPAIEMCQNCVQTVLNKSQSFQRYIGRSLLWAFLSVTAVTGKRSSSDMNRTSKDAIFPLTGVNR